MSEKKLCCVIAENPLLILFLGACPAMGATTTVLGAVGMGVAALVVMLPSTIQHLPSLYSYKMEEHLPTYPYLLFQYLR